MKKLLIILALVAISALVFAEYKPNHSTKGASDYDAFYGIEDYNDPFYGDAYNRKTAG